MDASTASIAQDSALVNASNAIDGSEPMQNDQAYFLSNIFFQIPVSLASTRYH